MHVQALIYLGISVAHVEAAIKAFVAGDRHAAGRDILLASFYAWSAVLAAIEVPAPL